MASDTFPPELTATSTSASKTSNISLALESVPKTTPDDRLEYTEDTPGEVTITLTNESPEHISAGELYIEALPTAHVTPVVDGDDLMPFGEPYTWEFIESLKSGESITLTLTVKTDGLDRDAWDGQIDMVANCGMDIIAKKTVFIKG